MGRVLFYHLTDMPLEATLPLLLGKSLEAGYQVDVRGTDPERLDWLDQKLWLEPADGFLPHGLAGGPHDALQPVLLTRDASVRQATHCLMAIDGAEVAPEEPSGLQRVCILFDGHDEQAVSHARGQWRALTGAGCAADYWAQRDGRWSKQASSD